MNRYLTIILFVIAFTTISSCFTACRSSSTENHTPSFQNDQNRKTSQYPNTSYTSTSYESNIPNTPYQEEKDALVIQNMIDQAKSAGQTEVVIPKINPVSGKSIYNIGSTIYLPSDISVILDGCVLRFEDGVFCNMFASVGALDASGASAVATAQKNIKIIGKNGATLDGGTPNGKTERTVSKNESIIWNSFILFRNVDTFEVSGLTIKESRYWGMTYYYARNGKIHDIHFNSSNKSPNQDGIDLRTGCNNIEIYNISGVTGDDTIALTNLAHNVDMRYIIDGISDVDIHDITIKNINAGCSGGHGIIRLLAHDTRKVYNITIDNVRDTSLDGKGAKCNAIIRIGDTNYSSVSVQDYGDITNVNISNVSANSNVAILVNNSKITPNDVTYKNITSTGQIIAFKKA